MNDCNDVEEHKPHKNKKEVMIEKKSTFAAYIHMKTNFSFLKYILVAH
jgi:hypothetical protein